MDETSYRFWSTVGIWVTPVLTAAVAAVAVLLATRWEADRAETRARGEARRRSQIAALEVSYQSFVEFLIEAANALARPGTGIGRRWSKPPLSQRVRRRPPEENCYRCPAG